MRLNENGSKKESISENPEPEAKRNVQATVVMAYCTPLWQHVQAEKQ